MVTIQTTKNAERLDLLADHNVISLHTSRLQEVSNFFAAKFRSFLGLKTQQGKVEKTVR